MANDEISIAKWHCVVRVDNNREHTGLHLDGLSSPLVINEYFDNIN